MAGADHEFSHRVEVVGRAVDAEGRPVPGAPLALALAGAQDLGPCYDARDARTDETGDFRLCRHVHAWEGPVEARVTLGNHTARAEVDPLLRRAFAPIRLEEPWGVRSIQGERAFARSFVVTGRLMQEHAQPVLVEEVPVRATPRGGVNVSVALRAADGAVLANGTATTGFSGDWRVELEVGEVPQGARVVVEAPAALREEEADARLRRADVAIAYPRPAAPPGTEEVPGPLAPLAACALAVAALLGRAWGRRGRRRGR